MNVRARIRGATVPLVFTVCLVASVIGFGSSAGAYTEGSTYPHDGQSWTQCDNTQTVRDATWYSGSVKHRLQVFYCSQGYYFARASNSIRTSIGVSLTRKSPYRYDLQIWNNSYAAMTNGVAKRGGSCYFAYANTFGKNLNFCA